MRTGHSGAHTAYKVRAMSGSYTQCTHSARVGCSGWCSHTVHSAQCGAHTALRVCAVSGSFTQCGAHIVHTVRTVHEVSGRVVV